MSAHIRHRAFAIGPLPTRDRIGASKSTSLPEALPEALPAHVTRIPRLRSATGKDFARRMAASCPSNCQTHGRPLQHCQYKVLHGATKACSLKSPSLQSFKMGSILYGGADLHCKWAHFICISDLLGVRQNIALAASLVNRCLESTEQKCILLLEATPCALCHSTSRRSVLPCQGRCANQWYWASAQSLQKTHELTQCTRFSSQQELDMLSQATMPTGPCSFMCMCSGSRSCGNAHLDCPAGPFWQGWCWPPPERDPPQQPLTPPNAQDSRQQPMTPLPT